MPPMLAGIVALALVGAWDGAVRVGAPCTRVPQPCPSHPGVTFCPSSQNHTQCDAPMPHPPCPPCAAPPPPLGTSFSLAKSLGDNMVLQRAPGTAHVWGFAPEATVITTTFKGQALRSVADASRVWRQALPPQQASYVPTNISFVSSDGSNASLSGVLFGDVHLCSGELDNAYRTLADSTQSFLATGHGRLTRHASRVSDFHAGQSNMQYTPRSFVQKKGCIMNNASAEVASAADYAHLIRLFTVAPFSSNSPHGAPGPTEQQELQSVELKWSPASPHVVGAQGRFTTFSAMCWLYGKQLHDELRVPIGLVSSAVGGTNIGAWSPLASTESCNATGRAKNGGNLANTMIYPFSVGPMGFRTVIWYQVRTNLEHGHSQCCRSRMLPSSTQVMVALFSCCCFRAQGEANAESDAPSGDQGLYYGCVFPAMIQGWRKWFSDPSLPFGFVQVRKVKTVAP
eukprot:COSAG02_NODE_832_length_16660_cov_16.228006_5_plen_456_part_00